MALPLAVFEDRNVTVAQADTGSGALPISSPSTEQNRMRGNAPKTVDEARAQQNRKQPEISNDPHSLAGSVMLLRSRQPSTLQLPPPYPASTTKHATGRSEELVLPDELLRPPSPRSMQILGKSRGLKRDRLDSSQPTPPAKRPAVHPHPAAKPRLQKGKAAVRGLPVSSPQPAQPGGSNWWSQGSPGQPVKDPPQWAFAAQANMVQDASHSGYPTPSGAQYMQLSGRRDLASWQPAYPSGPPVPYRAYTRGNKHIPNDTPAWASAHEQEHSEASPSSPPVSRRSMTPANQSKQISQKPVSDHPTPGGHQQPRAERYTGRSQDMQMQDLVNEVLGQDAPACWTSQSTHKQHSRAGAPSWSRARSSSGQLGQIHPQLQRSWPAPEGGRYVLASPPVSKKQQPGKRPAQAEWKAQYPQQSSPLGSLDLGCVTFGPLYLSLY